MELNRFEDYLNLNVLLCERYDEQNNSIVKIFDSLRVNAAHRASFTIMTMLSERKDNVGVERKIGLHYYITTKKSDEEGDIKRLYMGSTFVDVCDEKNGSNELLWEMECKNVLFLVSGEYRVEVYLSENVVEGTFDDIRKKSRDILSEKKCISRYDFNVIF